METRKDSIAVIDLLVEHEDQIRQLYEFFAEALPAQREFWAKLAAEEGEHAALLQGVADMARSGQVTLRDGALGRWAAQSFVNYVRSMNALARRHKPSLSMALSMALDIEETMIEKGVFNAFDASAEEGRRTLEGLKEKLKAHFAWFEVEARKMSREK